MQFRSSIFFLLLWLLTCPADGAEEQGTRRITLQGRAESSSGPVIRDALNKPCLDVEAISRRHTVNPDLIDHVVSIKNACARLIKVNVCYFNSDRCKSVDVGSYKREDVLLGTMTKVSVFRYSLSQK